MPQLEALKIVAQAAGRHGILVMLAANQLDPVPVGGRPKPKAGELPADGFWERSDFDENRVKQSWQALSAAMCSVNNVIAVDLMDEPFNAGWGYPTTDDNGQDNGERSNWDQAATRLGNHVLQQCSRWMIMVQGVGSRPGAHNQPRQTAVFPGENLVGAKENPIVLSNPARLIYSPHICAPRQPLGLLATRVWPRCDRRAFAGSKRAPLASPNRAPSAICFLRWSYRLLSNVHEREDWSGAGPASSVG